MVFGGCLFFVLRFCVLLWVGWEVGILKFNLWLEIGVVVFVVFGCEEFFKWLCV